MKLLRKMSIQARRSVVLLCFLKTFDSVITANIPKYSGYVIPKETDSKTWKIAKDDRNVDQYANLIDILEQMNILRAENDFASCVTLERIVRNVTTSQLDNNIRTISVHLVFTEHIKRSQEGLGLVNEPASPQDGTSTGAHSNTHANTGDTHTTERSIVTPKPGCSQSNSEESADMSGLDRLSMKFGDQGTQNGTGKTEYSGDSKGGNATGAVVMPKEEVTDKSLYGGLSRTQVVVIATCSAVIGTFFLIAAAMRIRNYIKRYRDERAVRNGRRPSMGLHGSSNSSGNLRRDSSSSRASRQSNPTVKSGGNIQVIPNKTRHFTHNSSPTHCADHNPLLPVYAPANQDTRDSSSHGSLAFIDEESQSYPKVDAISAESDDDTEDHPLLRKSPDSGSTVDLIMPDDVTNLGIQSELSSSANSMTESLNGNIDTPPVHSNVNESDRKQSETGALDEEIPMVNKLLNDTDLLRDTDGDVTMETELTGSEKNGLTDVDKSLTLDEMDQSPRVNNDLDYDPCINNFVNNIAETCAITIGLNQSVNSLSNNPSYCYGNQSEYMPHGCYGNVAYSCPYSYVSVAENVIQESCLRLNGGSFENGNRGSKDIPLATSMDCDNGNDVKSLSPSDISFSSLSKESSGEPLLGDGSRTSCAGQERPTGADNPALQDSGDDDSGSTFSTNAPVRTQLVPLSEYHRSNPYSVTAQLGQDG